MFETTVIPTDGSRHALRAAAHGRYLAAAFNASVHVVHARDPGAVSGTSDPKGLEPEVRGELEHAGEEAIRALETAEDLSPSITTAQVRGQPSEVIVEYAEENDADLIAMGTHGRTGVDRYIAGSVTERVLRRVDLPVLTVRATERSRLSRGYDEVLVATDGSEHAAAAIDPGLTIAERTGARVHVVNIVDVGDLAIRPTYTVPSDLIDRLESEGEDATARIATNARDRGLEAVTEVREGIPATELLAYAHEAGVDLITMATAGRSGLQRFLVGSTTERIIRTADMGVLAVHTTD